MDLKQKTKINIRSDLLFPDLSYEIVGILFDVYNELGHGHAEKVYQKAIAVSLKKSNIPFVEQVYVPVEYKGEKIGRQFLDFLIKDKIILEIKKGDYFVRAHIDQVYQYLVNRGLSLGILAYFTPRTVHFKRIVNLRN